MGRHAQPPEQRYGLRPHRPDTEIRNSVALWRRGGRTEGRTHQLILSDIPHLLRTVKMLRREVWNVENAKAVLKGAGYTVIDP